MRRSKVYIAGFDIFRPDAEIVFASIRMSAAMLGLEALVPTDCDLAVGKDGTPGEVAFKIRESNITLLRSADAVIANVAPFRASSQMPVLSMKSVLLRRWGCRWLATANLGRAMRRVSAR